MSSEDKRINSIIDAIQQIASGDFGKRINVSNALDEIDGIATGINMLSEEIEAKIKEKSEENRKLNETIAQLRGVKLELSRSEKLFSQVFQTSPDVISISRLSDGVLIEVNKAFTRLTGYTRKEVIGHSVFELGMWKDETVREKLSKRLRGKGGYNNLEANFQVKDGSIRKGLLSASLLNINDEPHLLVVGRDITEIREAEEILQLTQKKYEELIRLGPDGVILVDTEGRIEMANPAFEKISGLEPERVVGLKLEDYKGFYRQDLPRYKKTLSQLMKGKVPKPLEMKFKDQTGIDRYIEVHLAPVRKNGRITGAQAVVRDISDRIKAIEALRISEDQYRTSMDAMHDAMYVINPELEIVLANQSLQEGLSRMGLPAEVIGKNYMEAFPFLASSTVDEYKEVFTTGKTIQKEESYQIADHERYTDTRMIPIFEGKLVTRVLTIVQDVTERKKAEKVRHIMYNISNAVNITSDLNDLFMSIQEELGSIFDTRNFFIAFYNKEDDSLTLPYFVDEKDSFDTFPAKKTLTGYMIRNDRPILMKDADIQELVKKGVLEDVGSPSKIWLGVPLKIKDEIIGALVVQNYEDEDAYSERDLEILQFVSAQIGLSIESKRAYDEVQVEKAYFAQLFEGAPETVVLTSNEGYLLRVNSEFQKLFGFTPEEVLGKRIDDLVVPDDFKDEARDISAKVARGEKILTETVRRHKNGSLIHVSVLGTPIEIEGGQVAVYGIYRDITDRKNAEIAMRESEEKLRNILYSSPDAITVSDLRGYITECNQAALEIWDCDNEEDLIGKNANDMVSPEYKKGGISQLKNVLRYGHIKNVEIEMITNKGRRIFVDLSASLIHDDNNHPIGIVAITQDITERKAYERDLKRAKDRAEESDRLKSAFLANMSHEIRTPMNAILGFSELLRSEELTKDVRDEYIRIINNKGNELMLIINDIIDISKIEAGDIKIVYAEMHVNDFLMQITEQFNEEKALMSKDQIQLRLNMPGKDWPVIISDEARLRQVFYNLISNALKFTHEGYVELGYTLVDNQVQFYVKDTGIGIAREKQDIIFDRFRQADESINSEFGGTGLGLAISKNLVSMLGGDIWMESEENQGSVFFFHLPLHDNHKGRISTVTQGNESKTDKPGLDLSGKKIAIAEDDSANYLFIESYLKQANSEIFWAKDGEQMLEIFRSEPDLDLILMDLRMPNLNGIDATRIIRKSNRELPVIAITAYAFADDREKSIAAGCNDYIAKPVNIEQLSEMLAKYLK